MKSIPRLATLGALLLALPTLLAPAASAQIVHVGVPDLQTGSGWGGSCHESYGPWLESGRVALKSRGYFPAEGSWTDGCGGKACDDSAYGFIRNSRGDYFYFEIHEVRAYGECRYSCSIETTTGTLTRYEVRGRLDIDAYEEAVWFSCGAKEDGTWIYDGMIYHYWNYGGGAPDQLVPAIESGASVLAVVPEAQLGI